MAALWILLLILVTYLLTISIVVVGQQVHLMPVSSSLPQHCTVRLNSFKLD